MRPLALIFAVSVGIGAVAAAPEPQKPAEKPAAVQPKAADERKAVAVSGLTEVLPGDMAVLSASAPGATAFDWTPAGHSRSVFDPTRKGLDVAFACGTPGEYLFVVSVAEGSIAKPARVRVKVSGPQPPPVTPTTPSDPATPEVKPPAEKVTAAVYVYEKDQGPVPPPVLSALNRLNRERQIKATTLEADAKNGTGEVPAQYRVPLAAAKEKGLPALVVTAGEKVLAVVKAPATEQAVMEAVK